MRDNLVAGGAVPRTGTSFLAPSTVPAVVAAVGVLVAGGVAAGIDDPYPGPASTAAMLHGFDLVNAGAALGVMTLVVPVRRGSHAAALAQVSLLAYLVYTYAFYLFGVGFSDLFLLHVSVFAAGAAALAAMVPRILATGAEPARVTGAGPRVAAVLLALLAVGLGGMWVFYAVHNAVTGDVPPGSRLVETGAVVHLGMALDLALLVPWYATAAVLPCRRRSSPEFPAPSPQTRRNRSSCWSTGPPLP